MLIASFLLPVNEKPDTVLAHEFTREMLLTQFGGYTVSDAMGAWKDDEGNVHMDESARYEVAFNADFASYQYHTERFKSIAKQAGKTAGELAIYVVIPGATGNPIAEIINL